MNVVGKFVRIVNSHSKYNGEIGIICQEPIQECYFIKLQSNTIKCFHEQDIDIEMVLDNKFMPIVNNSFVCHWCNILTRMELIKFRNGMKVVIRYCPKCLR